jgi:predicted nucleic acid-binding protein
LDRLDLLGSLFQEVQVPQAVLAECVARPELVDARRIQVAMDSGLLKLCTAQPIQADGLGAGECAAIGRAVEISAALLADDRAARRFASGLGLTVIGTLGVLVRAKRKGLVSEVRPLIEHLRAGGHHLGGAAIDAALAAAGE